MIGYFLTRALQALGLKVPFSDSDMEKYFGKMETTFKDTLSKAVQVDAQVVKDAAKNVITLPLLQTFLPINQFSRPGKMKNQTRCVILHYTAGPGQSAQAIEWYFSSLAQQNVDKGVTYGSTQLCVGLNGEILQLMPLDEVSYNAGGYAPPVPAGTPPALIYRDSILNYVRQYGNPNWSSIGIEMCIDENWKIPDKTVESTAMLTAYLCQAYKLDPTKDLYRHGDITIKECPKPWMDDSSLWDAFKIQVKKFYDENNFGVQEIKGA